MLEFQTEEGTLRVLLKGEIDHHSAGQLREQIDCKLDELLPRLLVLDFGDVTFMDSSGIGLVMGRVRQTAAYGGKVEIAVPAGHIRKVMQLSGIDKIARMQAPAAHPAEQKG